MLVEPGGDAGVEVLTPSLRHRNSATMTRGLSRSASVMAGSTVPAGAVLRPYCRVPNCATAGQFVPLGSRSTYRSQPSLPRALHRRLLMKRQQPTAILTDEDTANERAIGRLFRALGDHAVDQHTAIGRQLDNLRIDDLERRPRWS